MESYVLTNKLLLGKEMSYTSLQTPGRFTVPGDKQANSLVRFCFLSLKGEDLLLFVLIVLIHNLIVNKAFFELTAMKYTKNYQQQIF